MSRKTRQRLFGLLWSTCLFCKVFRLRQSQRKKKENKWEGSYSFYRLSKNYICWLSGLLHWLCPVQPCGTNNVSDVIIAAHHWTSTNSHFLSQPFFFFFFTIPNQPQHHRIPHKTKQGRVCVSNHVYTFVVEKKNKTKTSKNLVRSIYFLLFTRALPCTHLRCLCVWNVLWRSFVTSPSSAYIQTYSSSCIVL